MTGIIKRRTANYNLFIPTFDAVGWEASMEANFDSIDAVLFAATGLGAIEGIWENTTLYSAASRAVDQTDNSLWQCAVTHTSASTGTFEADRLANPTYWDQVTSKVAFRGQWLTGTAYNVNEFLFDANRYGVALRSFTSGANYDTDVTNNDILTLIDLSTALTTATNAASAASTSESNASTSESNASTSASTASSAASTASTAASNAATSEGNAGTSASNASTSESNAAASASAAAASGDWTTHVDMEGFHLFNGGIRKAFDTWDGTALVSADIGKRYSIAMGTYNTPALPDPSTVPVGWYVTFEMNGSAASWKEFNVIITGRTTENFKGYSYPFHTFGRGEVITFINDGTDYIVEPEVDCEQEDNELFASATNTGGFTSGGTWTTVPKAALLGNSIDFNGVASQSGWQLSAEGIYEIINTLRLTNFTALGATNSAVGEIAIGDNSSHWDGVSSEMQTIAGGYALLDSSGDTITTKAEIFRATDEYLYGWYNVAAVGRVQNNSTRGVSIQWKGRR